MFLPQEELGDERQRLNHPDTTTAMTYKRAHGKPTQDDAQKRDSVARVIIIQVLGNKMARGHAGTEASSRSACHAPIDPYSVTYTSNLGLLLEL